MSVVVSVADGAIAELIVLEFGAPLVLVVPAFVDAAVLDLIAFQPGGAVRGRLLADGVNGGYLGSGVSRGLRLDDRHVLLEAGEDGSHGGAFLVGESDRDQGVVEKDQVVTRLAGSGSAEHDRHLLHSFPIVTVHLSGGMNAALARSRYQLRAGDLKLGGAHAPRAAKPLIEVRNSPAQVRAIRIAEV